MVKIISNTWVKEELSREIFKYFELKKNEGTIYQNLWDSAKGVLRRTFSIKCKEKNVKFIISVFTLGN